MSREPVEPTPTRAGASATIADYALQRAERDNSLTGTASRLIIYLARQDNTTAWRTFDADALAAHLGVHRETVYGAIRAIRRRKYIEQRPAETRSRKSIIRLTPPPAPTIPHAKASARP